MAVSKLQPKPSKLRFGVFEADFNTRELFKHGARISIQEQPFEILCMLLERAGEIVSREELRQRLWPENTHVEYEDSLNTAVRKLRAAISDSSDQPRYIETVARRGYRLIAPVTPVGASPAHGPAFLGSSAAKAAAPNLVSRKWQVREPRYPRWLAYSGLAILALAAVAGYWLHHTRGTREVRPVSPSVVPMQPSIAVLPLENLSADPAQEYFAEGVTDEITTRIAVLPGLKVISRTSAMQYKSTHKSLPQIGKELGVDAILEGTVERSGERVRLRVQLIQAATDQHLWAQSYERRLSDILALENEFAVDVADQVQVRLAPQQRSPGSGRALNPVALEDYLKGRYFWNRRDGGGLQKAVEYFQKAVQVDPNYAPAYAGLAQSYILLTDPSRARLAADKALSLDPQLSEAHTALALLAEQHWNFMEAEREYKLAISLNPNYATAHHWYGESHLALMGRFEEADREMEQARALDPVSRIIATDCGAVLYFERRYDEAYLELSKVLEMEPNFSEAYLFRGEVLLQQQRYKEAIADFESARRINNTSRQLALMGYALGVAGKRSQAAVILRKLKAISRQKHVEPWSLAMVELGLGDKDETLAWLEKAYREQSADLIGLKVVPAYDPLRNHPRFQQLTARIGLP